ncbi:hypothetical protein GWK47_029052 [Chionoecetes opilio]|uniref:Uncharacterized protein n=1 Tax=Chionoecetes opilio TaxID=41210 RepID=A0A8J5D5F4_CHIOP|nr:hypothetical protein GWK47_029052 [Chionoecetes opilio]
MACERRSTDVVWLLEMSPTSSFPGNRLLSRGEVLQVFLFHHKIQKEVLFAAAASTAEKVLEVWRRANIPTSDVSWVKKKILKLYEEYGVLAKSKSRKTETEEMKRCIFRDSLEDMFDIAHSKAMEAKIPEEDKAFLEAQREDRQSCSMAGVDEKLKRVTEEKRLKRQRMEEMKKKDAAASSSTLDRDVALESSTTSSLSNEETEDDDFKAPTPAKCPRRRPPKKNMNKLTKELTLAWERDNLSIRAATSSYAAAAMSLGHDIEHITVSRSSIHRARVKNREEIAMSLSFKPEVPLVLHWDGKLLPSLADGRSLEERVAVLVSGEDTEELLGVPVSADGTGQSVAETVLKLVRESSLEGNIIGMAFDMTAANTGMVQGVCIRIERALEKPLVWLACHHYILEVVLKDVFEACMGPSSGLNIALFKRLQNRWPIVDQSRPQPLTPTALSSDKEAHRLEMLGHLKRLLDCGNHPREDYKEIILLSVAYLGGGVPTSFRAPGAYHMARWMAKAIYAVKIMLFHDQLEMSRRELAGIRRVAFFVTMVYAKYWNEAMILSYAAKNDLDFITDVKRICDDGVASVAERAMRRHLWYLSENLIGLAIFDDRISPEQKAEMVEGMKRPSTTKNPRRSESKTPINLNRLLSAFCSVRSMQVLKSLLGGQQPTFLELSPETWNTDSCFKCAKKRAGVLKVTNDLAERGIALIQRFLGNRTKDERQTQFLLKRARLHTKAVPKKTKAELKKKVLE